MFFPIAGDQTVASTNAWGGGRFQRPDEIAGVRCSNNGEVANLPGRADQLEVRCSSIGFDTIYRWIQCGGEQGGDVARKVRIDMVGDRYGRLVGLEFHETRRNHAHWLFQCDCGETTIANGAAVRAGRTTSCGCLHREVSAERLLTHGHRAKNRHDPTYRAWQQINTFCRNPASPRFRDFGGRGVAVCPAWRDDFEAFLADMGRRPSGTVLARLDARGDFEPGNCRWEIVRSRAARAIEAHRSRRAEAPAEESGWLIVGLRRAG